MESSMTEDLTLKLRRQLREAAKTGESVDPADKCVCEKCFQVHYIKREKKEIPSNEEQNSIANDLSC